jgi:hypothetical protein
MQRRGILGAEQPVVRQPPDDLGEFELAIYAGLRDLSFGLGHGRHCTPGQL